MDGKKELQHHLRRKMIDFETKSAKFLSEVDFANYLCSARSRRLERAMRPDFERKCASEDPLSSGSHFVKSYVDFCILVPFDTDKIWMHEPCFGKAGRPKSNLMILRLVLFHKDIKTLSGTVFRSLIGSIFSEEIEFQNLP